MNKQEWRTWRNWIILGSSVADSSEELGYMKIAKKKLLRNATVSELITLITLILYYTSKSITQIEHVLILYREADFGIIFPQHKKTKNVQ